MPAQVSRIVPKKCLQRLMEPSSEAIGGFAFALLSARDLKSSHELGSR